MTATAAAEGSVVGGRVEGQDVQEAGVSGGTAPPPPTESGSTPGTPDRVPPAIPVGDSATAVPPSQGPSSSSPDPVPAAAPQTPGSRTGFWLLVILLLAALGAVVAALLGHLEIPGITPQAAEASAGMLTLTELFRSP